MPIADGIRSYAAGVSLAFLAALFAIPVFQSLAAFDSRIEPGCEVGGERFSRVEDGAGGFWTVQADGSGGCELQGSVPPLLMVTPEGQALSATGIVIDGAAWIESTETAVLSAVLSPLLLAGAGILLVALAVLSIILA